MIMEMSRAWRLLDRPPAGLGLIRNTRFAHCQNFAAVAAGGAVAALSADAALSRRPPVSTLMAWRWLTGRRCRGNGSISRRFRPCCRVRWSASEDAKFCSHHGIDWDALQDVIEDAEDGEAAARRLDHHPAGRQEPVPVAGPQRDPQGRWNCRWRCGSTWCCPSSGSWKSTSTSPNWGPSGQFGAEAGVAVRVRPFGGDAFAARGGPAGGDPAQSGEAQRPQSRPRRAATGRDLCGAGQSPRPCSGAGAKIVPFEPIFGQFNRRLP